MSSFYHFAYTSLLNDAAGPECITSIIHTARSRNRQLAVTGMLVFDGQSFFQYLEGPSENVLQLVASIRNDGRHRNMVVVSEGVVDGVRNFPNWSMAYALTDDEHALGRVNGLCGAALVGALEQLIPELDIEP